MANKKRTTVTIETRERMVVLRHSSQGVTYCAHCGVEVLRGKEAEAAMTDTSGLVISHNTQAGEPHFREPENEALLNLAHEASPPDKEQGIHDEEHLF